MTQEILAQYVVVDSSGWIEYFREGPNAGIFAEPICDTENLIVPSITIYEVAKVLLRESGRTRALPGISQMRKAKIINLNDELAASAALISLDQKLAMADSIILATSHAYNAVLWTQDEDFEGLDGVKYFAKI